ncbi:MAG TPA: CHAD domain-containing protein [Candidatus Binataceae bacterium]|nr:CHAD domain-containing protein [Candidatus Binataceae bacterium]
MDNAEEGPIRVIFTSRQPEELVHERVRRFMKLFAEILNSEQPEAVHDLRVWSRRLQQVIAMISPDVPQNPSSSVMRSLRQIRQVLSGWRDCDVLIALLDKKVHRLRNADEQEAWQMVRAYLVSKRGREIQEARDRLARRKFFTLAQRTEMLLKDRPPSATTRTDEGNKHILPAISGLVKVAYNDWQTALKRASESNNPADAHDFRVKTKQLRYGMELARDLGDKNVLLALGWLKGLLTKLGTWHDRAELARIATKAIARHQLVITAPRSASKLFRRLARELEADAVKLKRMFAELGGCREHLELEAWIMAQNEEFVFQTGSPSVYESSRDHVNSERDSSE